MPFKLCIIGAGSVGFTRKLCSDILSVPEFEGIEIALTDISQANLDMIAQILRKMVEDHHRWTGSRRARELLDHWSEARSKFVKVFPNEYKRALGEIHARQLAAEATHKAKDKADGLAAKGQ